MESLHMLTQRNKEGYFLLDHSQTEGIPDEVVIKAGLPPGAGQGVFEAPTFTCSHCQGVVIMHPNRQRERTYCSGCDHLICDNCGAAKAAGAKCRTMKQVFDELMEQAVRQGDSPIQLS
jgi:hypothetical protein